jgi:hypothetical protein
MPHGRAASDKAAFQFAGSEHARCHSHIVFPANSAAFALCIATPLGF